MQDMKQLTDEDLAKMAEADYSPDDRLVTRQVRSGLHLGRLIPATLPPVPRHAVLDLHQRTEEEAWALLVDLVRSKARRATVITGASGILKTKFQDWVANSILAPHVSSWKRLNNGSFEITIRKPKPDCD
jgi:DNA-nicking Smr family endonuclease